MCTFLYYRFLLYVKRGIFSIKKKPQLPTEDFRRKKKLIFDIPLVRQISYDDLID